MNESLHPHRARKRFGQNFLRDENIIERIVEAAAPGAQRPLVEIGPGQGALTGRLLERNGRLDVVEIDRDLAAWLRQRFADHAGFTLHEADALKFDFSTLADDGDGLHVVGNLPYNISTPLLFRLLESHRHIASMLFMLQREVVQRLAAGVGDDHYGRLGIMAQYYCEVEPLFHVPPEAFVPRPRVESAVVRLVPHRTPPCPARDPALLSKVVRVAFSQRRKAVRNSLKTLVPEQRLRELGIDTRLRPENLTLQEYVKISNSLEE